MLRTRLLTAAVAAPLVLAVVLLGDPWLSLLLATAACLALVEIVGLLEAAGHRPPRVLTVVAGAGLTAAGLLSVNKDRLGEAPAALLEALDPPGPVAVALVAVILLLGVASFGRRDPVAGFASWATSTFGAAYVGLLLPTIALVAHLAAPGGSAATPVGVAGLGSGVAWTLMLLLIVWGYDTGAYLVGRAMGRTRLVPHISPAKTVEGAAGGIVVATLGAGLGAALAGLDPWHAFLLGPLVGLAAQAGDLAESLLKRAAGRKESGSLVPGHGGILDRVDSFLFAAPVLAGYAMLVAGRGT